MDVQKKLDEIVAAVGGARSMPMSASCVINRAELLDRLAEVREALPGSLAQARELIGGRDHMVEEARREADRIIESAQAQRGSLISDTEIARRAQAEADRILHDARREADEIRAEADDYVDSKLANFEVVLAKTIGAVDRGREKLLGRGPGLDEQGFADTDAPEPSPDPQVRRGQADAYVDTKLATFEAVLAKTLEAVGRGRQKLLGRAPTDDLGAHMAAQDAAEAQGGRPSSDADFLAGLAEPGPEAVRAPIPAQAQPQPQYDAYPYQQPVAHQDAYAPAAYAEPYADPYVSQGYGGGQQDPYGAYQQQTDPYGAYQQQPQTQGQVQGQVHPQAQQQAALDETSFFDTSMINVEQLRQYEQGR
ncbi:cell division initiation protein [Streptomyces sp. NPDC087917]|uniref:DivIVA domain-containing protein n=1 Tax=unclassified Streptomyces TaxID=2593676 RepID=UPI00342AE56A